MRDKKRQRNLYILISAMSAAAVLFGVMAPGYILKKKLDTGYGVVKNVPQNYYSAADFAMARNASAKMKVYDRLRLISGSWESDYDCATVYEMNSKMHDAVAAAREGIDMLCRKNLYPRNIMPEYGNWYGWQAVPHKAVDSVFNTYTGYYWKVIFKRYDSNEQHIVYVTEDGVLIAAEAVIPGLNSWTSIADVHTVKSTDGAFAAAVYTQENTGKLNQQDWIVPYDVTVSDLKWKDMVKISLDEDKSYYVMQFEGDGRYVISVRA